MSDSQNGIGGYILVALIAGGVVYSCTDKRESPSTAAAPQIQTAIPSASPVAQAATAPSPPPIPKPTPRYDSAEQRTYYYGAAVSDEERKTGKRAPDMLGFWYLGRDDEGRDRLQRVLNGQGRMVITCLRPCKVIHYSDGSTIGFDEGSVIGSAFSDAAHGFLKVHAEPKLESPYGPWSEYQAASNGASSADSAAQ